MALRCARHSRPEHSRAVPAAAPSAAPVGCSCKRRWSPVRPHRQPWADGTCTLVVGELYSSWEILPAPAVSQANAVRMMQLVVNEPESLKGFLLGASLGKGLKTSHILEMQAFLFLFLSYPKAEA